MNKNNEMKLTKNNYKDIKDYEKKPKRIEWLNIYSKGFIVESINNNYINQDIKIKNKYKGKKSNKNIIPRNLTTIFKKGIKSNISQSNYSSKRTNFSCIIDNIDETFCNKNKLLISDINIKSDNKIKTKANNIDNEKEKVNKNNSINSIKNHNTIRKEKNKNKSVKMKTKISLKKDINSPVLNYIEFRNKNLSQSLFNSINNSNKKYRYEKNNNNLYSKALFNKTAKKDNNNKIENLYINMCKKNSERKKSKARDSKSIKEITINNINLIEIHKYMIEGRKFKGRKSNYMYNHKNKDSYKDEMIDYSFDDEEEEDNIEISERKNIISFSEICSSTNNYMTNKKGINIFFGERNKDKENLRFNLLKSNKY